MLGYNYIIFMPADYCKVAFHDVLDKQQIRFISKHYQPSSKLGRLYSVCIIRRK